MNGIKFLNKEIAKKIMSEDNYNKYLVVKTVLEEKYKRSLTIVGTEKFLMIEGFKEELLKPELYHIWDLSKLDIEDFVSDTEKYIYDSFNRIRPISNKQKFIMLFIERNNLKDKVVYNDGMLFFKNDFEISIRELKDVEYFGDKEELVIISSDGKVILNNNGLKYYSSSLREYFTLLEEANKKKSIFSK